MEILYINTSKGKVEIGLITKNQAKFMIFEAKNKISEILLTKIDKLLTKNKIKVKDLDSIAVFRGPGSFTGLRIGIATANALGFALNISLIEISETNIKELPESIIKKFQAKKFKKIVVPFYGKPPTITKPKSRN